MDLAGAFIHRVVGSISPQWELRLLWARSQGDAAGKAVIDAAVRPGDTVVDVGANFGLYTARLARLVGPGGTVYAFEPHPAYGPALSRIAAKSANVTFVGAAASDAPGAARLAVPERGQNTYMGSLQSRGGDHAVIEVPATTLDLELGGRSGIRLIKCDVEGHEHEVFIGAEQTLRRDHPILFVEIEQRHRRRPVQDTFGFLTELGYEGYMMRQATPRPLSEFEVERDQTAHIADDPTVGLPPPEYVNDFLFIPAGSSLPL